MKRIYISGGMTGVENYKAKFIAAEEYLEAHGFTTCNPVYNGMVAKNATHEEYMHMCLAQMDICDAIYLLDRWEQSPGAREEMEYAMTKGFKILYENEK